MVGFIYCNILLDVHLAIACNAVIDGLWMEGGVLPSAFAPDELSEIGIRSVGALLGIDLTIAGQQT